MNKKPVFDIPIGLEVGPKEMVLDEKEVRDRLDLLSWTDRKIFEEDGIVPPGITINQHAIMKFESIPELKVSIWAKSEHEFLKPIKVGTRITIRGKVVDKYEKRDRVYVVSECETLDETGAVLMRSREIAVQVE